MYTVGLDGDRKPKPLLHGPTFQRHPSVSPDGRWIAYTSGIKRTEIFVSKYPELSSTHQVSLAGGREAKWRSDGHEIVYRWGNRMFAASVDTATGLSAKPRVLFEGDYVIGELGLDYDIARDGRFLMIKPSPDELRPGFRVTLNWVDELVRRVPKTQ